MESLDIRVGIVGYGNLGRGAEASVLRQPDMKLAGVFTRRDPASVETLTGAPVYSYDSLPEMAGELDVLILCGGSSADLPAMTPELAAICNVVDSFDTHAKIPEHLKNVEEAALPSGKVAISSCGWDPGLFSLARIYSNIALPSGKDYTFWGKGVSQGHSDAIRRIDGVLDARQYTVPIQAAVDSVRAGEMPEFTTREKHRRDCFVVAEEGADLEKITEEIVSMPNYFADYDTTVTFITKEELDANHSGLPHGGSVIRSGRTGLNQEYGNTIEFSLDLDSNPYFTSSILVAYARAAVRLNKMGLMGCLTPLDVSPVVLSPKPRDELIAELL